MWEEPGQPCRIHAYTVYTSIGGKGRCHTKEGSTQAKESTLALKPRANVTRSPKQGYQGPHKKDLCPSKFKKKILSKNQTEWSIVNRWLTLYATLNVFLCNNKLTIIHRHWHNTIYGVTNCLSERNVYIESFDRKKTVSIWGRVGISATEHMKQV